MKKMRTKRVVLGFGVLSLLYLPLRHPCLHHRLQLLSEDLLRREFLVTDREEPSMADQPRRTTGCCRLICQREEAE